MGPLMLGVCGGGGGISRILQVQILCLYILRSPIRGSQCLIYVHSAYVAILIKSMAIVMTLCTCKVFHTSNPVPLFSYRLLAVRVGHV